MVAPRQLPRRLPMLLLLAGAAALLLALPGACAWRLPSSSAAAKPTRTTTTTTSSSASARIIRGGRGKPQQPLTRRHIFPPDDEEEQGEWPAPLERQAEEFRQRDPAFAPRDGENGMLQDEMEEMEVDDGMPTFEIDGVKQKVRYEPSLSLTEDLWPFLSAVWKSVVFLGPEGSSRRAAQTTILSVGAMGLGSMLLFFALLPAGFIHGPRDTKTMASRPTYNTKTYINPDKVLEEDFYRAGGVYLWDDLQDDDDY